MPRGICEFPGGIVWLIIADATESVGGKGEKFVLRTAVAKSTERARVACRD